ncbi:MAG: DUF2520 domain-containing protein [Myxococcota bacterium]|nr:DUF2520 domain-containing protein [Myxococcota bacterium]
MARRRDPPIAVLIYGAGKVGRSLARALRAHGVKTKLLAARSGLPRKIVADVVVMAVRDRDLGPLAQMMAAKRVVSQGAVVVHVAGALDASPLAPLRGVCAGVAQMHPMIAFASTRFAPGLARGNVHVQGDWVAVTRARRIARLLGMTPRTIPHLDTIAYHAAAGLVANGAAALAAVGVELLTRAGVLPQIAPRMLGPLMRSVADNVEALGLPRALTGPVRRGEAATVTKHLATLREKLPEAVDLYLALVQAQIPPARAIGEAPAAAFEAIARLAERASRQLFAR